MLKYWAYINGQTVGPLEPEELKKLPGFNRGTMVYPDSLIDSGTEEDWKPAFKVSDIAPLPFTQIKHPVTKPVRQLNREQPSLPLSGGEAVATGDSFRGSETQNISPIQTTPSDIEKIKMMEHIQKLEGEIQKLKNQDQEINALKSQLNEKEMKVFDLSQELKKLKKEPVLPSPALPAVELSPSISKVQDSTATTDYLQLDIPIKKILQVCAGFLMIGIVGWLFMPDSYLNQFVKRLWLNTRNTKGALPAPETPISQKTETKKQPAVTTKKKMEPKDKAEQEILQKSRRLQSAKERVGGYLQRGISMNDSDPSFRPYLKALSDQDLEESELKNMVKDYKKNYGETVWNEFKERANKVLSESK